MRKFDVESGHDVDEPISEVVEDEFGTVKEVDNNRYLVEEPDLEVVDEVEIHVEEDAVRLDIEEVPLEEADFDKVPNAVESKNRLLERLTGKTVADRKQEMREEVLPDEDWVEFQSS